MKRPDIVRLDCRSSASHCSMRRPFSMGSEARGDAQVDSDIDLLILLDGDHLAPEREWRLPVICMKWKWRPG